MKYKLGKLPATKDSVSLRLRDYLSLSKLPLPPKTAGNTTLVDSNMFGNDTVGDCTCADVGHATLFWNRLVGKTVSVSTNNVLALYSAVTGYNGTPETDRGANMADVAKYHKKTGLEDETGTYHKCAAYTAITPGNLEEIKQSIYLFGACSIGWELPESAQEQTQEGKPWAVVSGSPIEGGHDTLAIAYGPLYLYVVTWGMIQKVEWSFVSKYMDEGITKFSEEMLKAGKSPSGLNAAKLLSDLKDL